MLDIQDLKSADEESEKIMWLTEDEFEELLQILRKKTSQEQRSKSRGKVSSGSDDYLFLHMQV